MSLMPWSDLIRAVVPLGITPCAFWALSVCEWRALFGQAQTLDRARLKDLIAAFPDDLQPNVCEPPIHPNPLAHAKPRDPQ
jgi:hypothetical protein